MPPSTSATASSKSATAPTTKWSGPPAPASRTSSPAAPLRVGEGSQASGTSKETELKLTNVARASLEELLADYRDFLPTRGLPEWDRDHPYAKRLRALNRQPDATYETFRKGIEHPDPEISANVIIGLIKVGTYLLDQQIRRLEKDCLKNGGLRERMTHARIIERDKQRKENRRH